MRPGAPPQPKQVRLHGPREVSSLITDPPGTPVIPCLKKYNIMSRQRSFTSVQTFHTHTHLSDIHLSHTALSHTHATLSCTNFVTHTHAHTHTHTRNFATHTHMSVFVTHNFVTHTHNLSHPSLWHTSLTHNFVTHTRTHTQLCHTHTHVSLCHAKLCHTHNLLHTSLWHASLTKLCHTHNFVINKLCYTHTTLSHTHKQSFTHTSLTYISHTHLCHTRAQLCHAQSLLHTHAHTRTHTRNFATHTHMSDFVMHNFHTHTRNLSHTSLWHTSLTHNFVTHNFVMHNLCYTQLCCRRGFYGTGLGRCWSGWALRVAGVALGDINAAFYVAGVTFSDIDVVIRGTWWHRPSEAEKLTAWCQQPMVLARFVWLQITLSMRLSFTPRSQTYISKHPFHAQPSHELLFNKHLCHTHTRPHTCIRPQLVRRSPTASSSLILQVLKNHTYMSIMCPTSW